MTATLAQLLDAIATDEAGAVRLLEASPNLAAATVRDGATRAQAAPHFIASLACYAYEGDTALHFAAAAYRAGLVRRLVALGADVNARNRRGAAPLHYACVGDPSSGRWNPAAQVAAIEALIAAGADANAIDRNGATPLHRAVRTRCAAAVRALLAGGADASLRTKAGSSPARLAAVPAGRGGSGSPEAKAQQAEILRLLDA